MKRSAAFVSMLIILLTLMSACGQTGKAPVKSKTAEQNESKKISIVCTIFPAYDWVKQIIGGQEDRFEVFLLPGGRADLHNYQPTVDDVVKISTCDMFIFVGGESEKWVGDILRQAVNKKMIVVSLIDILRSSIGDEQLLRLNNVGKNNENGRTPEHSHDDAHEDEDSEIDEHVWLSVKNTSLFCREIANGISSLDTDNAEKYMINHEGYDKRLSDLDKEYQAVVTGASVKTLLFCGRFPFIWLAADYGLDHYAAFPGCSAETEASFSTIIFLAGKIDELGLKTVIETENDSQSLARTIISNTKGKNQKVLVLDSIQSATPADYNNGISYLSIMESNLNVLKEALK